MTADTGSGKTTQLTQRLAYIFHSTGKRIVCTQPRRLASRRVVERVAEEMEVGLGNEVGVQHRGFNRTSAQTLLKFVTEGILLRERQHNASLDEYVCTYCFHTLLHGANGPSDKVSADIYTFQRAL